MKWHDKSTRPNVGVTVLAYCPGWSLLRYTAVKWNGSLYECDYYGTDIDDFVDKWAEINEPE